MFTLDLSSHIIMNIVYHKISKQPDDRTYRNVLGVMDICYARLEPFAFYWRTYTTFSAGFGCPLASAIYGCTRIWFI